MSPLTALSTCGAVIAAALLAVSYWGSLHPVTDSLAVLRPVLAVAVAVFGWALLGPVGLIAPLLVAAPLLWPGQPVRAVDLTLYQKNLLFRLPDPAALIADIQGSGADVVTLQELHSRLDAVPKALLDRYPHQQLCNAHAVGRVAILSRHPILSAGCVAGWGMTHARIAAPGGEITVVALHLHWPYPQIQTAQVDLLLPVLRALPQPVIAAGDFNMVPRTHTLARIARATKSHRARCDFPTFWIKGLYPITIDHLLLPQGWRAQIERRPLLGSDHFGLRARISRG